MKWRNWLLSMNIEASDASHCSDILFVWSLMFQPVECCSWWLRQARWQLEAAAGLALVRPGRVTFMIIMLSLQCRRCGHKWLLRSWSNTTVLTDPVTTMMMMTLSITVTEKVVFRVILLWECYRRPLHLYIVTVINTYVLCFLHV